MGSGAWRISRIRMVLEITRVSGSSLDTVAGQPGDGVKMGGVMRLVTGGMTRDQ